MLLRILAATFVVAVLAVGFFLLWLRRSPGRSMAEVADWWEKFLKSLTGVTAVVAGIFGAIQYLDARQRELEHERNDLAQRTREFNVKLYEGAGDKYKYEFTLYNEAVDVAATLAASDDLDDPDARIARKRFERLYWGQMAVMEKLNRGRTERVEDEMIRFRNELLLWEKTKVRDPDEESPHNLKRLSLHLAHACGEALQELSRSNARALPVSDDSTKSPAGAAQNK